MVISVLGLVCSGPELVFPLLERVLGAIVVVIGQGKVSIDLTTQSLKFVYNR